MISAINLISLEWFFSEVKGSGPTVTAALASHAQAKDWHVDIALRDEQIQQSGIVGVESLAVPETNDSSPDVVAVVRDAELQC